MTDLQKQFGELRARLHQTRLVDPHDILALLQLAHQTNALHYQEVWRPYLSSFEFQPFHLTDLHTAKTLSEILPDNVPIILDVTCQQDNEPWHEYLTPYIPSSRVIKCTGFDITDDDIDAITRSIHMVTHLDLSQNQLTNRHIELLLNRIDVTQLHTLKLEGNNLGAKATKILARNKHLLGLQHLALGYNELGDRGAIMLAKTPYLRNLNTLNLWHTHMTAEGLKALARCPHLNTLQTLNVSHNLFGDLGVHYLASSHHMGQLVTLDLSCNDLGNDALIALSQQSNAIGPKLKHLDLRRNQIANDGIIALAQATGIRQLESLKLWNNNIGPEGLEHLLVSYGVRMLRELDLSYNPIAGAFHLLKDDIELQALETLHLNDIRPTQTDLKTLSHRIAMPELKHLHLTDNDLIGPDIEQLIQGRWIKHCHTLNLSNNRIEDDVVHGLLSHPLPQLKTLDLSGNELTQEAALALLDSPALAHIPNIHLRANAYNRFKPSEVNGRANGLKY